MGSTGGRRYVLDLLIAACITWVIAWRLAALMHGIQHSRWSGAYLLVPVNQTSLYFFPLASSAFLWVARRAGRLNTELLAATILVWLWMAGRIVFWTSIATELGRFPKPDEFSAIVPEHIVSSSAVSIVGLAAILVLCLGIIRTVYPRPARRTLAPLVAPSENPK